MIRRERGRERRQGFTLVEILVTIALVAVLAAALVPALNKQLSKGDSTRISNDLLAVQTALSTFTSDIKRSPGDLSQLISLITPSQADIASTTYSARQVAKWKGPYLTKELVAGNVPTGFDASLVGDLDAVQFNGVDFVRVELTPMTLPEFNKIDEIIDETVNSSSGQLRYDASGSGTASYFAVPVQ